MILLVHSESEKYKFEDMKIVFIGQKGIPAVYGGVEKHVEEIAVRLARAGHDVTVFTRPSYTPADLTDHRGVKLRSVFSLPTKHLDAITHTFLSIFYACRLKPDVVHFHSIGPSTLLWLAKLLMPRSALVATFHTQCYHHAKWNRFARWYLKIGEWMINRIPDRTITVSRVLAEYTLRRYGRVASYIPNGVALPRSVGAHHLAKWDLQAGDYILSVSRLIRHKGIHHLIRAYQKIYPDKKLVIVGSGFHTDDYVAELEELAVGDPRIIFTGNQSGQALEQLFANAALFVQPSESEGLSIALLEAMSYGLPIIASDIPENQEALGRAGYFFRDCDSDDLADKIRLAISQPAAAQAKGREAKQRVTEQYSWEKISAEILALYESVRAEK